MAAADVPTHGKLGAMYRLRPNGFKGDGLNDVTWGTFASATDSSHFEVVIDSELGGTAGVDTFKWRENGGSWTEDVDITGSSQDMVGANGTQPITFAATKGHTEDDQWTIGNLKSEPCTEATIYAQITDTDLRLLNPNVTLTWTEANNESLLVVEYCIGKATFSGTAGATTVTGNNGYILKSGLEKVAYLIDWSLDFTLDVADASRLGQNWKEILPGQASANGAANGYLVLVDSFWKAIEDNIDTTQDYFLLQLFSWDPDKDQSGDHFSAWVTFTSFGTGGNINEVVKEAVAFQVYGIPSFTANA